MSCCLYGSLDEFLIQIEGKLIFVSAIPVFGAVAGLGRATLVGAVQTVAALAVLIFSAFAILFKYERQALLKRSAAHIVHGIGNIVGGCIEAIPLVGTLSFVIRVGCSCFRKGASGSAHFIGYASLVQEEETDHVLESAQNANLPSYEQHYRKCRISFPLLVL